ncbi:hypothetical protein [Streptomyces sp. CB03911]|uniref:hypothetical protein n=1 Tax=Streptomyces sp. CB03911 TaxID=1804758 RepID=UPI00093BCE4C|nr:hypothetical protein [Streptomyces sp. CB03911]OKI19275.1 hypothetical protein A6A07_07175 [Streptomyces sp. CB03911]
MTQYLVRQTKKAFRYPEGKIWGPYLEEVDAQQRLATLRSFGGAGVIEAGEFGTGVALELVGAGGPGGVMAGV